MFSYANIIKTNPLRHYKNNKKTPLSLLCRNEKESSGNEV